MFVFFFVVYMTILMIPVTQKIATTQPRTHRQLLHLLCQWHSDNIIYFIYCVQPVAIIYSGCVIYLPFFSSADGGTTIFGNFSVVIY